MVVVDSSVWIDYFRRKTAAEIRTVIEDVVAAENVALTEPVLFETLRAAPLSQRVRISAVFDTYPRLPTRPTLWGDAVRIGQACAERGFQVPSMDLLIAQTCIDHQAEIVTFDRHFEQIARVAPLKVGILDRRGQP